MTSSAFIIYILCIWKKLRLKVTRFSHAPQFPPLRWDDFVKSCFIPTPEDSVRAQVEENGKLLKLLNFSGKKERERRCCLPRCCQGGGDLEIPSLLTQTIISYFRFLFLTSLCLKNILRLFSIENLNFVRFIALD